MTSEIREINDLIIQNLESWMPIEGRQWKRHNPTPTENDLQLSVSAKHIAVVTS